MTYSHATRSPNKTIQLTKNYPAQLKHSSNRPQPVQLSQEEPIALTDEPSRHLTHHLANIALTAPRAKEDLAWTPVKQQGKSISSITSNHLIQRDLALEPPETVTEQEDLSPEAISDAIRYNRLHYPPRQIRLIQDVVGATVTGQIDAQTVRLIATFQENFGLTADGKLGPDTFALINQELEAEQVSDRLIMFSVTGTGESMWMDRHGNSADFLGRFNVHIRLPAANCGDYEYRQYICGNASYVPANAPPTEPDTPLNPLFRNIPGGRLPSIPNWVEDGDTSINARYGHRSEAARQENRYRDEDGTTNQAGGCIFESYDYPGLSNRQVNTGELYDFDFRFRGVVRHKTRGIVSEQYWTVRGSFTV